jgi:translation initiation factor 3 subunit G
MSDTNETITDSKVDANGMKERVRIMMNQKGQRVRQVMRIKVTESTVKTPKRVEERKNLPRFGDAKEGEENVTLISKETIPMEHPDDALIEDKDTALAATLKEFIERKANREIAMESGMDLDKIGDNIFGGGKSSSGGDDKDESGDPKVAKYVSPGARAAAKGIETGVSMSGLAGAFAEKDTTIRVSNLTKSVCEDDLRDLFGRFGRIARVALPRNEIMRDGMIVKEPRGFAYITFASSTDAALAFDTLQGYGYDHLILKLEWSKPAPPRDGPGGSGGGLSGMGFTSGYGTKLAQDTKEKVHGYTDQAANNRMAQGGGFGGGGSGGPYMPR